jgi:hypothetical protein
MQPPLVSSLAGTDGQHAGSVVQLWKGLCRGYKAESPLLQPAIDPYSCQVHGLFEPSFFRQAWGFRSKVGISSSTIMFLDIEKCTL